jgi:hypothetical protein
MEDDELGDALNRPSLSIFGFGEGLGDHTLTRSARAQKPGSARLTLVRRPYRSHRMLYRSGTVWRAKEISEIFTRFETTIPDCGGLNKPILGILGIYSV